MPGSTKCGPCGDRAAAVKFTPDPDPPRTVRYRMAVGQRANGDWYALGGSHTDESRLRDGLRNFDRILWIEVDAPVFEEITVTAEVVG